ncbi:calcium-transporting P [Schizophyllum commune H4-8]|uniref:calcium-transporting P n=1 Tax=Schizophyllum commune (strain H4-8 / FGSC 9210) TaxID=578458 RepID=UPI002160C61F|nr:calcium-transporting P [Schizophyllum commune H4-8]KAI5894467.1 calcium-transporting P [Schizophyllum commune H4-8]
MSRRVVSSATNRRDSAPPHIRIPRRATSIPFAAPPFANTLSPREESPPASAYFTNLRDDSDSTPRPAPGAEDHFAYSTTLRRHGQHSLIPGSASAGSLGGFGLESRAHASAFPYRESPGPQDMWGQARALVRRAVAHITGQPEYDRVDYASGGRTVFDAGETEMEHVERKDTASARYAHMSIEETVSAFSTSATDGLDESAIPGLRERYGYNEFTVGPKESLAVKLWNTLTDSPLIPLLLGSAFVSALVGNVDDAVSITVAVAIVLTVGFIQERRSEESLAALNKLVPHHCHVIRAGRAHHVLANELVPGDVVTLSTGDRVPADLRLVEAVEFEVDESSLTGETEARVKGVDECGAAEGANGGGATALADRTCVAYMGTLVRNGRGRGIVIATGRDTEFGVVFSMMEEVDDKRTPLQLSMDALASQLSMMSFAVIGVICLIGVLQHRSWLEMFTIGVSLAVAAIPEGLPIVTTVTLALGVLRMANRKAIVKKLHSVEALGCVSVVCSDKTGTLTKNEQTVVEAYTVDTTVHLDADGQVLEGAASVGFSTHPEKPGAYPPGPSSLHPHPPHLNGPPSSLSQLSGRATPSRDGLSPALRKALEIGALCNNASVARNGDGIYVGHAMDVALLNAAEAVGMRVADRRGTFRRQSERPFSSETKYMAVSGVHTDEPSGDATAPEVLYMKGAIEAVLPLCRSYHVAEGSTPDIDATMRSTIMSRSHDAARRGLRVLAMAYGRGSAEGLANVDADVAAPTLVFAGFCAMLDPPRKGVSDAVGLLRRGGVHVVMITGDAEETAAKIAGELGLGVGREMVASTVPGAGRSPHILTGADIDGMTPKQLEQRVGAVSVFARTTPRHKMRIVAAFQARGEVVAMTGDGVNDAPALRMADIGVSMGKSGTDVAKEAADVILVDDNFTTLLPAVEEGKSIFHNIQNFIGFQLSTAVAALSLITCSTLLGLSNPLNAMQILFINILMDGPPSQSLGVDPVDPAVMRKPPRKKDAAIITKRLMYRVLFSASLIVAGVLLVYLWALEDNGLSKREQTLTFTAFVVLDLVSAIQNRSLVSGLGANRMLALSVSISLTTQLSFIYVPFLQRIFQTEALGLGDISLILILAGASFAAHEARRTYERKLNVDDEGLRADVV